MLFWTHSRRNGSLSRRNGRQMVRVNLQTMAELPFDLLEKRNASIFSRSVGLISQVDIVFVAIGLLYGVCVGWWEERNKNWEEKHSLSFLTKALCAWISPANEPMRSPRDSSPSMSVHHEYFFDPPSSSSFTVCNSGPRHHFTINIALFSAQMKISFNLDNDVVFFLQEMASLFWSEENIYTTEWH